MSAAEHLQVLTEGLPDDLGVPVVVASAGRFRPLGICHRGNVARAAEAAVAAAETGDVYVATTAVHRDRFAELRAEGRRGGAADCAAMLGAFADLDVAGPGHKSTDRLPPTLAAARAILEPLPTPTLVVETGGGLHAWWLLDEPCVLDPDNAELDREVAGEILSEWVATVDRHADRLGFRVDRGVGELARVLRLAGTLNHKTAQPRPVRLADRGPRHRLVDLLGDLDPLPAPTPARIRSNAPPRTTGGPDVLDALRLLGWHQVWPPDWEHVATQTRAGDEAELWRRPGASSDYSAVCWAEGCQVHTDALTGLPAGGYSKADVFAWRHGLELGDLARALIAEAKR